MLGLCSSLIRNSAGRLPYICFLSNRAGPYHTFVRPFPDVERRGWQISNVAGYDARWSPARNETFYRVCATHLMAVPYETDPEFKPSTPRQVLDSDFHDSAGFSFAMSADGQRILINKPEMSLFDEASVTLVTDWFDQLERAVPVR